MLQLLSRRWWGVTGWGYLLSLGLAICIYWMLPTSHAVHRWSFQGFAQVAGFFDQNRALLVKQYLHGAFSRYKINLQSGQVERYLEPEVSDLKLTTKVPYTLFHTRYYLTTQPNELSIRDTRSNKTRTLLGDNEGITLGGGAISGGRIGSYKELHTSGSAAMSFDENWLLMSQRQPKLRDSLIAWLRQKTGWSWPFISEGFIYHGIVIHLSNDLRTPFPLRDDRMPDFDVHPQGLAFAVTYCEPYSTLGDLKYEKPTVIEWYSLPLGTAHHSFGQWCVILAAFGVPVMLSMLWNAFRRMRRGPVAISPHP